MIELTEIRISLERLSQFLNRSHGLDVRLKELAGVDAILLHEVNDAISRHSPLTRAPALYYLVTGNSILSFQVTLSSNVVLDGLNGVFKRRNLGIEFRDFLMVYALRLMQLPVPNMMGVSAPMQNAGVVRNTGIELQLGHNNRINDWSYSIGANFSYVTTKIIDLKGGDTPGQSVGDPLWAYYGYVCDGIFQNEEEIKNHPTQSMGTPVPGDLKYRDLNGDKVVDSKDRQVLGSYFPKINFGLNLSVQYKDFDLSALLQGAADVKSAPVAEIRYAFYNGGKVTEQHLDRWTPENPNATYPRLSMSDSKNRVTSSFWMQDASYAKLRNLQVGYSLPKQLISKYGISRLRVYCSIDNLFMISGFDGVDPEAISGNYYPLTRNYSFGLNVTF